MASVSKDRDRADWRVKWRTPDGRYKTETGYHHKRNALARKAEIETQLRQGTYRDPRSGGVRFREVAAVWLDSKHDLKPRTRSGYAALLKSGNDIDQAFGGYPVDKITRELVSSWVARRTREGKRPSTVRNAFFVVQQVLEQAYIDKRLPENPCSHVRLPSTRVRVHGSVEDSATFLDAGQLQTLAEVAPWPYSVMFSVAGWTGLRAGEIAGLQVGDVDLRQGLVRVRRTVIDLDGQLQYDTPKTRRSTRSVPLTPQLAGDLRDYLAEHPRTSDPAAPLFPWRGRGKDDAVDWTRFLRHGNVYVRVFKPAVLAAGLPGALRFHDLRHTYASLCVSAGLHPKQISDFMGHANINTTMGIYAHLFEADHSEAMSKLGALAPVASPRSNVVSIRRS